MSTKVYYTDSNGVVQHRIFIDYNQAILFQNERVEEHKDYSAKII